MEQNISGADLPGIIADDFTGALDAGAQFARWGFPTRLVLSAADGPEPGSRVVVISTGSREAEPGLAAERSRAAARSLAGRPLFKKIDSTMRGHVGVETAAILDEAGCAKAVICPAAPLQGRVVRGGLVFVHGTPLHESAFRDDPAFPARTASLPELLGLPADHLGLAAVRGPLDELARAIGAAASAFVTLDAETGADLERICAAAQQVNRSGQSMLLCGAFGLADAWASQLAGGASRPAQPPPRPRRALVIAGSANAAARAQVRQLAQHPRARIWPVDAGWSQAELAELARAVRAAAEPVNVLCPSAAETVREPRWYAFSRLVSRLGAELLPDLRPDTLVIVGGETASSLVEQLAARAVDLLGEAAPGIPYGRLVGGPADGLLVISKAGGFGGEDALEKLIF